MLLTWLFRLLIPFFDDLVINPITKKASLKNLAATVGFVVGIGLSVVSVLADINEHRPVEKSAILLLLGSGLGLSTLKVISNQLNRETATPEGNPLATPGTYPPKLMPQGPADEPCEPEEARAETPQQATSPD